MEIRTMQSPLASNTTPPTPTTPVAAYATGKGGLPGGLEGTLAPADMINVLSAHRQSVNTADGKTSKYEFYITIQYYHLPEPNRKTEIELTAKKKFKIFNFFFLLYVTETAIDQILIQIFFSVLIFFWQIRQKVTMPLV